MTIFDCFMCAFEFGVGLGACYLILRTLDNEEKR